MSLTTEERRTLLNLWCRIARADGVIDDAEIEQLAGLFYGHGAGSVSADEINDWLENGPPEPEARLSLSAESLFLDQARVIMSSDGDISSKEGAVLRDLLETYFER